MRKSKKVPAPYAPETMHQLAVRDVKELSTENLKMAKKLIKNDDAIRTAINQLYIAENALIRGSTRHSLLNVGRAIRRLTKSLIPKEPFPKGI